METPHQVVTKTHVPVHQISDRIPTRLVVVHRYYIEKRKRSSKKTKINEGKEKKTGTKSFAQKMRF